MLELLNKIYWWLTHNTTTGESYHTLRHCLSEDMVWVIIIVLSCLGIFHNYLRIALSAHKVKKSNPHSKAAQGIYAVIMVFVVCGVTGYLFMIIRVWFPLYKLLAMLLIGLAGVSFWLWRAIEHSPVLEKLMSLERVLDEQLKHK